VKLQSALALAEANDGNGGMAAMGDFNIQAPFEPTGDQPKAIKQLTQFINGGHRYQTLLGATGTGKTHTIARVINKVGKPTLVLAHNKTLAAQLCNELREFFPTTPSSTSSAITTTTSRKPTFR
jgi:superfamily II DNA or RNA helicase